MIGIRAKTTEELAQEAKTVRQLMLDAITVEVNGKVFDGNDKARLSMLSAIQSVSVLGVTSANWKLADNTWAEVTVDELKSALALSIQKVGEILKRETRQVDNGEN